MNSPQFDGLSDQLRQLVEEARRANPFGIVGTIGIIASVAQHSDATPGSSPFGALVQAGARIQASAARTAPADTSYESRRRQLQAPLTHSTRQVRGRRFM